VKSGIRDSEPTDGSASEITEKTGAAHFFDGLPDLRGAV
jgi:hypothetical protein